ncbi:MULTISPECIES: hypothetical protein [Streptomyces]|uniref:Uncharacterized protein n=1 Tax=Streptomyces doudnae TaxID=3075536 RepID=A0ABD5EJ91_9ACTN|nr:MULTISPECIES: hypothetical protein [unclassified Streptomyces]MDT0434370.1 hypothetical protein [Streptomyces sp. DSM 41981]MYQ64002.1 hypothetical protein [Streptomyces sp. SID4950]SCD69900.1 hypothetical protein GA0115242_112420 [Streptomyces sp. SolWspMP-5a-2]
MLFVVLVLPTGLVLAAMVLKLVLHAVRRVREGGRPRLASPRPLALVSGCAAAVALLAYSHADLMYSPGLFPEGTCLLRAGYKVGPQAHSAFPLSTVCEGVEIVPTWVNPTVTALLALAAVTLLAVPFAHRVQRARGTAAV